MVPKKTWLSGVKKRLDVPHDQQASLGILAFETARTMSRLVSLHRSLSESEILNLRHDVMRSPGVAYLNSTNQLFLLRLAAADMVDELDHAADAIVRLSDRAGRNSRLREFQILKSGFGRGVDYSGTGLRLGGFSANEMDKKVKTMEKYIFSTSNLHEAMEKLAEMEASERKLQQWTNNSGPMAPSTGSGSPPGADVFLKKLAAQKKTVRKIQRDALWGQSFESITDLMAKAALTIFAKICYVFSMYVPNLPTCSVADRQGKYRIINKNNDTIHPNYSSGPLDRPPVNGPILIRNSGPLFYPRAEFSKWAAKTLEPEPNTVGDSGLAIRYADVIIAARKMVMAPEMVGEDSRMTLYRMLPNGIRKAVRAKMRGNRMTMTDRGSSSDCRNDEDTLMAEGWREAAMRILEWLAPMANDTSTWQLEKSCERKRLYDPTAVVNKKVFALQTLLFSDKEKTEAAIVEVLVGLCCVCRYNGMGRIDDSD